MDPTHTTAYDADENRKENHGAAAGAPIGSASGANVPRRPEWRRQYQHTGAFCHSLAKESSCPNALPSTLPVPIRSENPSRSPTEQQRAAAPAADTVPPRVDTAHCPTEAAFRCVVAHCKGLVGPPSLPAAIKQAFDASFEIASSAPASCDAVCGACATIDALARSYQYVSDEMLADVSLESVSIWLLCAAGKHLRSKVCPVDGATVPLVHDGVSNIDAGFTNDVPASARTGADDESNVIVPPPPKDHQALPHERLEHMDAVVKEFTMDLLRTDTVPSYGDWMGLCRGPARLLVRALRSAIATARALRSPMPILSVVVVARSTIAGLVGAAEAREAVAYMLGLLISINAYSADMRDTGDFALHEAAPILADPSHPLRSVVLEGLDIMGTDIEDADHDIGRDDGAPSIDGAIHPQDDLVMRVYDHEPDLFVGILSHADPESICALARTSRTHYALIARTLRDDDARGDARLLKRVALSGTVWLQDYSESGMYDPRAYAIAPASPDQQPLPSLRAITSTCKLVARIDMPREEEVTDLLLSMDKLAAACALGCGGAVARYLSAIKCDLDPGTTGKRQLADRYTRIARCAGMYASPMLMRIAITAMVRTVADRRAPRRRFMPSHQSEVQSLVISAVSGIVRGFAFPSTRRRSLPNLPALVDVLCAFLAAVRRDMDAHGFAGKYVFVALRASFCRAALVVLAPGTSLPMPSTRIRLASALFEAARPEPPS